jgi:diguanylate cyclase (GGDEF)-like protein
VPHLVAALLTACYLAVLGTPGIWGPWVLIGAAIAGCVVLASSVAREPLAARTVVGAWVPLHLLLLGTGSLESPVLPLIAAWVAWLGRAAPRWRWWGLLIPAAGVVAGQWIAADPLTPAGLVNLLLLLGVGSLAAQVAPPDRRRPRDQPVSQTSGATPGEPSRADEVLVRALELSRRATDAAEAALWVADESHVSLTRLSWAGLAAEQAPAASVPFDGHPFGWAVTERVPVHLERGRRDLPSPWAVEMLLVPTDVPAGVLALAYHGVVPPGAEIAALAAGNHVAEMVSLLRVRETAELNQQRIHALLRAVSDLPGELRIDDFAAQLAASVLQITRAEGVVIAHWDSDQTRGEILHMQGEVAAVGNNGGRTVTEGETRIALAMKHGISLIYSDLRREADAIPLVTAGERWDVPPRSAMIVPLATGGRVVGAVFVSHRQPNHFSDGEREFLELLCSVAPLPMQSARRFEELDRRASTDALTGLPNRGTFEMRFAAAAGRFQRYHRPFGLLVLDIDLFKRFNDTWGHEAGDEVLRHVGDIIRHTVREVDQPARLGGEEFVVILPETSSREAVDAAERLRRNVEERPVAWNGHFLRVTASVGVAACPESCSIPAELLAVADTALYQSKNAGRNRVTSAPPVQRARYPHDS